MKAREIHVSPPVTNRVVSKFSAKTFVSLQLRFPGLLFCFPGLEDSERSRTADPIISSGNYCDERGRGVTTAAER